MGAGDAGAVTCSTKSLPQTQLQPVCHGLVDCWVATLFRLGKLKEMLDRDQMEREDLIVPS